LLRNPSGQILLCELTYKKFWDLPGGCVDPIEPPAAAVVREIREELGLDVRVGDLLVVDWLPPWRGWDDACLLVFDLGVHETQVTARMRFEAREIAAVHWCTPADAEPHIPDYLKTLLPQLLAATSTRYLENGVRPPGHDHGRS
ncbi:MAG: NUDIX domain-containing protein, partial [Nocardioidaceae bacterium]